jgi:hypothetical protein
VRVPVVARAKISKDHVKYSTKNKGKMNYTNKDIHTYRQTEKERKKK